MLVIRSIRCSNFKGLDAIDIHAPDSGCVLIEGPNEAGKTSLLDAVRFAITGLPPSGATAESLIQTGASQATVFVRLAGDLHSIEVERVISRSNPSRIRMVTVDGFVRSTTESETEAMDCMDRLLGFSAEDLSRACFISTCDLSAPRPSRQSPGTNGLDPPRRHELRRVAENLGRRSEIEDKLRAARQRLELVEAGARLAAAEGEFDTLNAQLATARIHRAQMEFRSAAADLSSVIQLAAELEDGRTALREELRTAETRSATQSLLAALRGSIEADFAAGDSIDSINTEIAPERDAEVEAGEASRRLPVLTEARQCLVDASRLESEANEMADRTAIYESLEEALNDLVSRRSRILEMRGAREVNVERSAVNAGSSDIDSHSITDRSILKRMAAEIGIPVGKERFWLGWPFGSVATAGAAGIALLGGTALLALGNMSNLSTLVPSAALALLALGLLASAAISTSRQRAAHTAAEDAPSNAVADELLLTGIDDEIVNTEDQLSRSDLDVLRANHALAMEEFRKHRRRASDLIDQNRLAATVDEIDLEIARIDERLRNLDGYAARLRRLETELDSIQTRRSEIRSNAAQRVDRLNELWTETSLSEFPDGQELDMLADIVDAAGVAPDPVEISGRLAEISARIADLEPLLEDRNATHDKTLNALTLMAADAGVRPDPDDVEGSLSSALPDLAQGSVHDEYRIETEIASLQMKISGARVEVQSRESAIGLSWRDLDADSSATEVERLERETTIRQQAAQIAAKADAGVVRQTAARAEYVGRELLPEFVGGRYFDLRRQPSGAAEVWDERGGCWLPVAAASAGLRQQVELVLRLAGSSAALVPAAAGTPGFLFIDDPVSLTDRPRRHRIVQALTSGAIRDVFRQVFVFSISGTVDPRQFDYQISLENGTVKSSTLPNFKHQPAETAMAEV